jgi:hypothetical protein
MLPTLIHQRGDAAVAGLDKDTLVLRDVSVAAAAGTTANRFLGGAARDTLGIRATLKLCFPAAGGTGSMVY